jgi:hypothetical protein
MVGSWPCSVSSEVHIIGRRISDLVREDKGKVAALRQEDENDPKRVHVVLSQVHEVVGPGYSKLSSAAATETDKGRLSDNLKRVTRVGDRDGWLGIPNRVIRVNSREQQRLDYLEHVGWVSNTEQEPGSTSRVANTEQHSVNTENWVTQDSRGRKPEEGKGGAPSQKPAPRWCPRGIIKTQRCRLHKMCQKELAEKEEEQRGYWFNHLRPTTKVKQTWREKRLAKEVNNSSSDNISEEEVEVTLDKGGNNLESGNGNSGSGNGNAG